MFIVKNRIIFYILSFILIGTSLFSYFKYGLNYGIDFTGGSSIEIQPIASSTTVSVSDAKKVLDESFPGTTVRPYGETGFIIRTKEVIDAKDLTLNNKLASVLPTHQIARVDTIGPTLGAELKQKSITSIILVLLSIVLFITFAFRQVSGTVSSWKYGLAAIVALFHDIAVPVGFFSIMNHFENIVGASVSETFVRSINTSLTTILAMVAVYIWGPDTTRHFALVLIVGIAVGTYSSIFVGSNLLVTMSKWGSEK